LLRRFHERPTVASLPRIRYLPSPPRRGQFAVGLDVPHRKYRNPRFYEQPTTHTRPPNPSLHVTPNACWNALADAVRFFHIDALSSSVGLKVDFDMALLVIASGLYRLMAKRMRRTRRHAKSSTIL
jgi:hypothetical protein